MKYVPRCLRLSRLAPLLLIALLSTIHQLPAQRQFPYQFTLDSRSAETFATPDPTSPLHRYRVTAWGTYSMWEDTVNSSVDPVWIYSFPEEEWAKPEWRVFSGYPIYVGDPRLLNSHGLRVNGRPFPKLELNDQHRYSMIIQGDGKPVSTTIIDWNINGDAHGNNSGYLYVLVEELPLTQIELCAVDSSHFPQIRVSMRVLRDSIVDENILDKLSLYENGVAVEIDSVDCSEHARPVSVAMVFDRSGSMSEDWGSSNRMAQVKIAGRNFINHLSASDEAAVYSFSSDVTLDQSWTSDKELLRNAVNRLQPEGYTAMNDAVDRALRESALRPESFKKAVVVLSDGEDNISEIQQISQVIKRAKELGIPVFAIGLLLDNDDSLRQLALQTGGAYFGVQDPSAIDSVFNSIAELLFEQGCCNVWYTTPRGQRDGTWRDVEVEVSYEDDTVVSIHDGYRAPQGTSSVETEERVEFSFQVQPNPADPGATIYFTSSVSGKGIFHLYSMNGVEVRTIRDVKIEPGENSFYLETHTLQSGSYILQMDFNGEILLQRIDVVR